MAHNPLANSRTGLYFWMGVISLAGVQAWAVEQYYKLPLPSVLADALISWGLLGGFVFSLINTLAYYFPSRGRVLVLILAPAIQAALWLWLSRWFIFELTALWSFGNNSLLNWYPQTLFFRGVVALLILLAASGFAYMTYLLQEKEETRQRQTESENLLREAELFKLRQQLQPHFLFNSLNSVIALIGSKPKEARQMLQKLSEFFRGTVQRADQEKVSLAEELKHLDLYLSIEKVRFGHRLTVTKEVDDSIMDYKLPPLLIQPLVENAIKHGLYGTIEELEISMKAYLNQGQLKIEISNPYESDHSSDSGTGFGLRSVNRRLYLLYGRTDLLKAKAHNSQFTATLSIPKSHV